MAKWRFVSTVPQWPSASICPDGVSGHKVRPYNTEVLAAPALRRPCCLNWHRSGRFSDVFSRRQFRSCFQCIKPESRRIEH